MKRKWAIWISVGMLIIGVSVLLYPTVSSAINRMNGSYAIGQLQQQMKDINSEQMDAALERARSYNEGLRLNGIADTESYEQILNFGNGIIGYITIPEIDLVLPIYHGVSNDVLEKGVGHLPSSAFPIGGEGNHTVLTGHTGLPTAELFTDIKDLQQNDLFEVTIGKNTIRYQIDQILVVLPQETEELMPVEKKDYCTLVTCTPYGVNSHRLLVRGRRVEALKEEELIAETEVVVPQTNNYLWLLLIPCVLTLVFIKRKRGRDA